MCDKGFTRKSSLVQHQCVHTGDVKHATNDSNNVKYLHGRTT